MLWICLPQMIFFQLWWASQKNVWHLAQKFTGCMFLDFLVFALLYQNIQCWKNMIYLMCIRVPTYSRQFKNWVQQLPKFKTQLTLCPKYCFDHDPPSGRDYQRHYLPRPPRRPSCCPPMWRPRPLSIVAQQRCSLHHYTDWKNTNDKASTAKDM